MLWRGRRYSEVWAGWLNQYLYLLATHYRQLWGVSHRHLARPAIAARWGCNETVVPTEVLDSGNAGAGIMLTVAPLAWDIFLVSFRRSVGVEEALSPHLLPFPLFAEEVGYPFVRSAVHDLLYEDRSPRAGCNGIEQG